MTKNPITQKQINKQRDSIESGVQPVGSTNNPAIDPGLSQPDLGNSCSVSICFPGDNDTPGLPSPLAPITSVLQGAGNAINNYLQNQWDHNTTILFAKLLYSTIGLGGQLQIWKQIWADDPVKDPITRSDDGSGETTNPLHPKDSLDHSSVEYWKKKSTEEIVNSLKPGSSDPLIVNEEGTVVNGNTRVHELLKRGYDVNKLPRELYRNQQPSDGFWD